MSDVLSFTVPTFPGGGAKYPSVNELLGRVKGRKNPEYHDLRIAVREAARDAMALTGWITATYYVDLHWKRYIVTKRGFDPMNCMKCELDALEPDPEHDFPGVYLNDSLVRPHPDLPMYDPAPGAIDRVAIAVFRLYPPLEVKKPYRPQHLQVTPPAVVASIQKPEYRPGDPIPAGYAVENGRLIPFDSAVAMIHRELAGSGKGKK